MHGCSLASTGTVKRWRAGGQTEPWEAYGATQRSPSGENEVDVDNYKTKVSVKKDYGAQGDAAW